MNLTIRVTGKGIIKLEEATAALGKKKARVAYRRAVNKVGDKAFTQVRRATAKQAGLPVKVTEKYGKIKNHKADEERFRYAITSRGGDVPLKLFNAKESRKGVRASPGGSRKLFEHTFIMGGPWPKRTDIGRGGHVFEPNTSDPTWGRKFEKKESGVVIPQEMVQDQSREAFERTAGELGKRVNHEIKVITKGVVS